jgi:hypothetical protein
VVVKASGVDGENDKNTEGFMMYDRREVDWKQARRQRDIVRSAVSRIVASENKVCRFEEIQRA